MTSFLVRPMEPLYFGEAKSFAAGEAHQGRSHFPPSPYAFQGLVRTRLLASADPPLDLNDWSQAARRERVELIGESDALPASWQMEGPFPVQPVPEEDGQADEPRVRFWLPAPRFLLHGADDRASPLRAHTIETGQEALDDLSDAIPELQRVERFLPVGAPAERHSGTVAGWVSSENLLWALAGEGRWSRAQFGRLPPFVRYETRPGLVLDHARATARPGLLYFLEMLRFETRVGFAAELEGEFPSRLDPSCLTRGRGGAGRRRRAVAFEPLPGRDPYWQRLKSGDHLPRELPDRARVWMVLLTPARLADALRPLRPTSNRVQVTVRAALTGPPVVIGGYSMVRADVRPNGAYVPAGSAWLVELQGGSGEDRADLARRWNGRHVLGDEGEAPFGFGQVLVGLGSNNLS